MIGMQNLRCLVSDFAALFGLEHARLSVERQPELLEVLLK